jgi:hypothetical protein
VYDGQRGPDGTANMYLDFDKAGNALPDRSVLARFRYVVQARSTFRAHLQAGMHAYMGTFAGPARTPPADGSIN